MANLYEVEFAPSFWVYRYDNTSVPLYPPFTIFSFLYDLILLIFNIIDDIDVVSRRARGLPLVHRRRPVVQRRRPPRHDQHCTPPFLYNFVVFISIFIYSCHIIQILSQ